MVYFPKSKGKIMTCLPLRPAPNNCPSLPSATYTLNAGNGPFTARCEMAVDGGGWTVCYTANSTVAPSVTATRP